MNRVATRQGGGLGVFLVLLACVLGTGFMLADRAGPASKGGRDVAELLPENTLAHVVIDGAACEERGRELAVSRILREPEMQRFLAPLFKVAQEWMDKGSVRVKEVLGVSIEELLRLLGQRTTLSLVGMKTPEMPNLVMTMEFGKELDIVRRIIKAFEELVTEQWKATIEPATLAGVQATYIRAEGPMTIEAWYAVHEGMLLLGTDQETLGSVLGRLKSGSQEGSLAQTASYRAVKERVVKKGSIFTFFVDPARALGAFSSMLPRDVGQMVQLFELDRIKGIGYGLDLDGPGFRDRAYTHMPEGHPLMQAMQVKGSGLRSLDFLPASTAAYWGGRLNFQGLYAYIMDVVQKIAPDGGEEIKEALAEATQMLGIDVEQDLIKNLGSEIAVYLSFPRRAVIPDVGILLDLQDPEKVKGSLGKIVERFSGQVTFSKLDYKGQTIHYVDVGATRGERGRMQFINPKPAWAVIDNFLVVTLWPQSLKNLVHARHEKAAPFSARRDFRDVLSHVRAENASAGSSGIGYLDFKAMSEFVLDNGIPFAQSLIPQISEVPVDFAMFPTTETISQHLFGAIVTSEITDQGMYGDYYTPTGYLLPYMGLATVALWGFTAARYSEPLVREMPMPVELEVTGHSQSALAATRLAELQTVVNVFRLNEGRLPHTSEWPHFVTKGSENHPAPYADPRVLIDPWGNPFLYMPQGKSDFSIVSLGADGQPGGVGDDADIDTKKK